MTWLEKAERIKALWDNGIISTAKARAMFEEIGAQHQGLEPPPTQSPEAPAVAAPPTVTAGADRGGCKPWCVQPYRRNVVPASALLAGASWSGDDQGWCSALCRDERRPPIGSPPKYIVGVDPGFSPVQAHIDRVLDDAYRVARDDGYAKTAPGPVPSIAQIRLERARQIERSGESAVAKAPGVERTPWVCSISDEDLFGVDVKP